MYYFEDVDSYENKLPEVLSGEGPVFVAARVERGSEGPITRSEMEQSRYLQVSIAESAHSLRKLLMS